MSDPKKNSMYNSITNKVNQVKQMVSGAYNYLNRSSYIEEIFKKRFEICKTCEAFTDHPNVLGAKRFECDKSKGGCGCFLEMACRAEAKVCPKGKWGAEKTFEEYTKGVTTDTNNISTDNGNSIKI